MQNHVLQYLLDHFEVCVGNPALRHTDIPVDEFHDAEGVVCSTAYALYQMLFADPIDDVTFHWYKQSTTIDNVNLYHALLGFHLVQ